MSFEVIESKAIELLSDPLTALEGAGYVLRRPVKGCPETEKDVVLLLVILSNLSPSQKFDLLLRRRAIEEAEAKE